MNEPEYLAALRDLHRAAGYPSSRTIAANSNVPIVFSTVAHTLTGTRIPTWGTLCAIITALNGNPDHFEDLYPETHRNRRRPPESVQRLILAELVAIRKFLEEGRPQASE